MKKLNNYQFILLLGVLLLASCTDDRYEVNDSRPTGETVEVSFTYTVDKMLNVGENDIPLNGDGLLTRTVPEDLDGNDGANAEVKKMTVLQFNELDRFIRKSNATIGAGGAISVDLTQCTGSSKVIVLANAPTKFSAVTPELGEQFAVVANKVVELTQESDLYYVDPDDSKNYLFMSDIATIDFTAPPAALNLTFKRNVARVNLKLELSSFTLKSVRLRNVPKQMLLADQVSEKQSLVPYDTSTGENIFPFESGLIDYDVITNVSDYLNAGKYSFSWYVPRNEQGVITAAASKEKTKEKKPYATYFEIVVEDNTGYQATFSIVPGANNVDDYNLMPNKVYTTSLKVAGLGEDDDRISNLTTFEGYSNSYILNPPAVGKRTFAIPIKQVYKYWKGTAAGYGNESSVLTGTWEVSHLWSDVTATGVTVSTNSGSFNSTAEDGEFEVKVESSATNGNYIVALKAGGKILWSWHLWVTDYNPDAFTGPVDQAIYKYKVNGGYVDRYGYGNIWKPGGGYGNGVIMDRFLGALSDKHELSRAGKPGQLYYQFGRKDPFCPPLSPTNIKTSGALKEIKEIVQEPQAFYTISSTSKGLQWTSYGISIESGNIWYDSSLVDERSIYDPCPEGWQLPGSNGFLDDFRPGVTMYTGTNLAATSGAGRTGVGARYWPGGDAEASSTNVIWYPAMGYISHWNTAGQPNGAPIGAITQAYDAGTCYMANTHTHLGIHLVYSPESSTFVANATIAPSSANPVRCVKKDVAE